MEPKPRWYHLVAYFVGEVNLFEGRLTAGLNCLALAVAGFPDPIPLPSGTPLFEGAAVALAVRPEKLVLSDASAIWAAAPSSISRRNRGWFSERICLAPRQVT